MVDGPEAAPLVMFSIPPAVVFAPGAPDVHAWLPLTVDETMFVVQAAPTPVPLLANEAIPPPSPSATPPAALFPLTVLRVMFVVAATVPASVRMPPWNS